MRVFFLLFSALIFAQQADKIVDSTTQNLVKLKNVTISAIRAGINTPISFNNVEKEQIEIENIGKDLPMVLKNLPSVVTTSDAGAGVGYTGIRIRGSDASRVNITINGFPFNDAESHGTYWVNLPDFVSSVEEIQVQRGVGTSTNGSGAFGASININTENPSKIPFSSISSSLGSFTTFKNTLKFSTGISESGFEFSGRLSYISSDGYIDRASSNLKSYFVQANYISDMFNLKMLRFAGHEKTYHAWYGIDAQTLKTNRKYNPAGEMYSNDGLFEGFYENQEDNYKQDHTQLHYEKFFNEKSSFSLGLNYTYGRGFYEEFNDLWADQNILYYGVTSYEYLGLSPYILNDIIITSTENVTRKWLDNDFYALNANFLHNNNTYKIVAGIYLSEYYGRHFGKLKWASVSQANPNQNFYKNDGVKKDRNVFVKWETNASEKWKIYVDFQLRWVNYKSNGYVAGPSLININESHNFFNPKAGLTYKLNNFNNLYFSYSKGNKEPNKSDYENGSPLPEELDDFELGWRLKSKKINFNSNLFYMNYKNQLVLTGELDDVGSPIRTNSGDSYRLGVELEKNWDIFDFLKWNTNISLSKNINKSFYFQRNGSLINLGDTNISYSPSTIFSSRIIYNRENSSIIFSNKYVGEQYMGNIDSETSKLGGYNTIDLLINYKLFENSDIFKMDFKFHIFNLFNKLYSSNGYFYTYDLNDPLSGLVNTIEGVGYYPQAGRHFMAGVSLKF
ncbi:MAG: TonB-dependent receptor [Bacteroidota bacterium]|nr:TonB-dependent receptor [Bacteroidota bacterium]